MRAIQRVCRCLGDVRRTFASLRLCVMGWTPPDGIYVPKWSVKLPLEGGVHGRCYYDRAGSRKAGFSGARRRCDRRCGAEQAAHALEGAQLLRDTAAVPGSDGGVRERASLGARAQEAWP